MSQHKKLVWALILAVILGVLLHPFSDVVGLRAVNTHVLQPIGQIFLRLIFMVVVPLIFSALVLATNDLGQSHGLGGIAKKLLIYTVLISTLSVVIGISLVNTIKPGAGFVISPADQALMTENSKTIAQISAVAASKKTISQAVVDLIPKNPLDSALRALFI
jgi:DAACS family dicarboxylate/amino acid:cation (Na+ or H+) symporter